MVRGYIAARRSVSDSDGRMGLAQTIPGYRSAPLYLLCHRLESPVGMVVGIPPSSSHNRAECRRKMQLMLLDRPNQVVFEERAEGRAVMHFGRFELRDLLRAQNPMGLPAMYRCRALNHLRYHCLQEKLLV